jgi:mannose-6-phosphate isomerase-like protein (cupin superfamily)
MIGQGALLEGMTNMDTEKIRIELIEAYPGCRVKIAEDNREMVAEIRPEFAVAVIERSLPHFHLKTREVYRVLRGGLCVARAGQGHVLQKGETIAIEPGQIHSARAVGEPVYVGKWGQA